EGTMAIQRVVHVVTADTRKDISALINAVADHGFDPVGFLGGLIGESNLHEHATRERTWPDVSYGLSQPTVAFLHPDSGLPLTRDADGARWTPARTGASSGSGRTTPPT
ncbi:MAG TPA: hypothetical protein VHL09_09255, partial [Dehalococcoidia bacterium]|nr:hypothetical protein [Dehalococcoidia bacterium]